MITQQRASDIKRQAQQITKGGQWSDNLTTVMSPGEIAVVRLHWSALPPEATFLDAFLNILEDRVGELG